MAHEELNLQLLFQLAYLEPESRLCDPQNLRGLCEALLFAHSNEIPQLSDIHALLMASQIVLHQLDVEIIASERLYPVGAICSNDTKRLASSIRTRVGGNSPNSWVRCQGSHRRRGLPQEPS